jgi:hypothetical protein
MMIMRRKILPMTKAAIAPAFDIARGKGLEHVLIAANML